MKKTWTILTVVILALAAATLYLATRAQAPHDAAGVPGAVSSTSATTAVPVTTGGGIMAKYGFRFGHPAEWIVEEKDLKDFYGRAGGSEFYTGSAVVMTDPSFPKKAYDCCYTPAEMEQYGTKPALVLEIIESVSYPSSREQFGPKTRAIFDRLVAEGYAPRSLDTALAFVPSVGTVTDDQGRQTGRTEYKDTCSDVRLLTVSGNRVVRFSGCASGAPVEDTGALIVRKGGPVFLLQDHASEYAKLGYFDAVLGSFVFDRP